MTPAAIQRHDRLNGFAVATMVGLTMTWGFNQVAIKVGNEGFNPLAIAVVRAALASLLVTAWCRWRGVDLFARDGALGAGMLAGVLFGAEFALIFVGLDFTSAARGALMVNTMPFFVAIGAHLWLGERLSRRKLAGMTLAFAGVALVFSDKLSMPEPRALVGDALMLAAAVLWAATTLVIKGSALNRVAPEKVLLYQLAVSAFVTLPLIPFAGDLVRSGAPLAVASVLFQAGFVVAFTYVLWFWLVRAYPASALSNFAFLSPVFGVLSGGLLLGEPLTWRIAGALILIGGGLVIANRANP